MAGYAHPEVLVETGWVKENLENPAVKLVEIDVNAETGKEGRIPGAIGLNWEADLQEPLTRDILSKERFEKLMRRCGISPDDTVIFYGDHHNWFAAYGFWVMKIYGHEDVRLMNGGRKKWFDEFGDLPSSKDTVPEPVEYKCGRVDQAARALMPVVYDAAYSGEYNFVDVRSAEEFTGKIIAPEGAAQVAHRGGHIPGAKNIPWDFAVNEDGTFKSTEELRAEYFDRKGVDPKKPSVVYCQVGERSSHTWFVLTYLLGMKYVANYDGGWTEYGNMIANPVEK